jgi:multidrug resistance protein, MATE family
MNYLKLPKLVPEEKSLKLLRTELFDSIALAIPLAGSQLAQAGTGFIDTVMMGWMGPETLAAGGLAAALFMTLFVAGLGMTTGVTALVAEAQGASDRPRIQAVTAQGLRLAIFISLPACVILSQGETVMVALGQSRAIAQAAQPYLSAIAWGYFPALGFIMLRGIVSSIGSSRITFVISLLGLGFNAIGNYVLGFGKWGFPHLGLGGLAIATALTHWLTLIALIGYSFRTLRTYALFDQIPHFDRALFVTLIKLGLPVCIAFTAEVGLFSVTTFLMGRLGITVIAAHQIVFQTIALIFMVPLGVAYGTTIRVGLWMGKNDWVGVRRSALVGMALGGGFMAIMAMILILFPKWILSLYLDLSNPVNQPVIPIATTLLTIAALAQILDGVQASAAGALRGLQDTKIPMVLSFIAFWGLGLTTGCILAFQVGWGGVGLWIGQSIGIIAASVLFVGRFLRLVEGRSRSLS